MEKELREKFESILHEVAPNYTYIEDSKCITAMHSAYQLGEKSLAEENTQLKHDADVMFDALFAIISNDEIDDLDKCMNTASAALNKIIDKTRHDTSLNPTP